MAQKSPYHVITANRTDDGSVAYMRADKSWTSEITAAAVIENQDVVQEMLRAAEAQERLVCDAYAMNVVLGEGDPSPLSARELIRSQGPTTRLRRPDPTLSR
jgi:hypothetical protein